MYASNYYTQCRCQLVDVTKTSFVFDPNLRGKVQARPDGSIAATAHAIGAGGKKNCRYRANVFVNLHTGEIDTVPKHLYFS
jgi:hypothetical protein